MRVFGIQEHYSYIRQQLLKAKQGYLSRWVINNAPMAYASCHTRELNYTSAIVNLEYCRLPITKNLKKWIRAQIPCKVIERNFVIVGGYCGVQCIAIYASHLNFNPIHSFSDHQPREDISYDTELTAVFIIRMLEVATLLSMIFVRIQWKRHSIFSSCLARTQHSSS